MSSDYLIVDAHIHTFHTPEAGRLAMAQVASSTPYSGTVDEALAALQKGNMAAGLAVNTIPLAYMRDAARRKLPAHLSAAEREQAEAGITTTLLERLKRRNEWSCRTGQEHPELFATITLDPIMGAQAMAQEIRDKVPKYGVKAIKLHPPIGRFYPNDHSLWPAYQAAAELEVPIVFHCGPHPHPDHPEQPVEYSKPEHFEEPLATFPKLRLVLAHMGVGLTETWPELYPAYYQTALSLARRYPGLCFDLSATLGCGWSPEGLQRMIEQIGAHRVLFGSDFPWWDPAEVYRAFQEVKLGEEEKRLILGENALRIFKLELAPLPRR